MATQPSDMIEEPAETAEAPANDQVDPAEFYRETDEAPEPEGEEQPEGEEEQADPIDPPHSWTKEDKELFAQAPRALQEVFARRQEEADRGIRMKMQEAANTRQTVETEARGVIQKIMQEHADNLQVYAGQFEASPPDIRLLHSGDPQHQALYMEQDRQYRLATAQHGEIMQQAEQARQQAALAQQQIDQALMQREIETLNERLGSEWSDPSARAKLISDLEPIAAELGYSVDQMAQARASDILALKTARSWKADAEKYRQLMKRKMEPVRAARQIPPAARAGSPVARPGGQPVDTAGLLYPNDVRRN